MRLHEIDDQTAEIQDRLKEFFVIRKGTPVQIHNELVTVEGDVGLKSSKAMASVTIARKERMRQLRNDKLPVQFSMVKGNFQCRANVLTTLEGCPDWVGGWFYADNNKLRNLVGGPNHVGGTYDCSKNSLQSLEGLPDFIGGDLYLPFRKNMPILSIFFVKGIKRIVVDSTSYDNRPMCHVISEILSKNISLGTKGAIIAAAGLIRAGFPEMAKR